MNEVVKYNNTMNKISFNSFKAIELDLFMYICSKMKEKEDKKITLSFHQIKRIINYNQNDKRFISYLESIYTKLINLNFRIETDLKIITFILFTTYEIDKQEQTITIGVNSDFSWMLNNLTDSFTRFELEEFINLRSIYAKEFFRRMKQYNFTGLWRVSLEEFKIMLDIPKNYKMSEIDKRVLKPIKQELGEQYELEIKKIYSKKSKIGRPSVSGFDFYFKKIVYTKTIKDLQEDEVNHKFKSFYYRTIRLYDANCNFRPNYLKIIGIHELPDGQLKIILENQDDKFKNTIIMKNEKHLYNFINKYSV